MFIAPIARDHVGDHAVELFGDHRSSEDTTLPIVVDLDGTLLRVDTLHEAAFGAVCHDPRVVFQLPGWLAQGKARLKSEMAARWSYDPARLPYSQAALDFLEAEQAAGRRIVLCTAADRAIANRVAETLGFSMR